MKEIDSKELVFNNSFVVMPKDCNYMFPLIFGGAFMAQLDLCGAALVNKVIKRSNLVNNAVTFKADFEFVGPSYSGDLIHMHAVVTELRKKSIAVKISAYREPRNEIKDSLVAVANFVFVTRYGEVYKEHGLTMKPV